MIEYNKLVRDKIPEIIEASDKVPKTHIADDNEFKNQLFAKLDEEVKEFVSADDPDELVDVLEILYAIAKLHAISPEELETKRQEKVSERGGFTQMIILERVE